MSAATGADAPSHVILDHALVVAGSARSLHGAGTASAGARPDRTPLTRSGVWSADAAAQALALSNYRNRRFGPRAGGAAVPEAEDHIPGLAIFGGVASMHFGHLVTQSLGRLWAGDLAPEAPILFVQETGRDTALPGYFTDLARRLGLRNELRLLSRVTRCDRLLVPQDVCNLRHRPPATPWFRTWLAARHDRMDLPPAAAQRVYVSRSRLGQQHGQYLQERVLEAALEDNGYHVFHPQDHPIGIQLATYAAADRLIFADGSAGHLWSLVARPGQRAAVILRRPLHHLYARWFQRFHGPSVSFIDCGIADFWARGHARAAAALLDLGGVWAQLAALGFHADPRRIGPDRDLLLSWAAAQEGRRKAAAAPVPLDRLSADLLASRRRCALRRAEA